MVETVSKSPSKGVLEGTEMRLISFSATTSLIERDEEDMFVRQAKCCVDVSLRLAYSFYRTKLR